MYEDLRSPAIFLGADRWKGCQTFDSVHRRFLSALSSGGSTNNFFAPSFETHVIGHVLNFQVNVQHKLWIDISSRYNYTHGDIKTTTTLATLNHLGPKTQLRCKNALDSATPPWYLTSPVLCKAQRTNTQTHLT